MRFSPALVLLLAGCVFGGPEGVHYVLGQPYQAGGVWRYPREEFALDETALATTVDAPPAAPGAVPDPIARAVRQYPGLAPLAEAMIAPRRVTADGETYDPTALAAAHPTLQLPALARLTNLENGRQVMVRINDRGPGTPTRGIAITPRAAQLLAAADPTAIRVRIQVMEDESRRMAGDLRSEGPRLQVAAAPAAAVQAESLAPPPGATQSAPARGVEAARRPAASAAESVASVPLRLPDAVVLGPSRPGNLVIECGSFGRLDYADGLRQRLVRLGARVAVSYTAPVERAYTVSIGPLPTVAAADAMWRQAFNAGAIDARIVVE